MSPRDAELSKQRILEEATKVFAAKTFEGARVDEIAAKAGVNKALIYYYFKSKRNILDTIIENFLDEGIEAIFRVENAILGTDPKTKDRQKVLASLKQFYDYLETKKDILIIMMVESLIQGGPNPLLQIVERYSDSKVEEMKKSMTENGMIFNQDHLAWLITEIFTGLLPSIMFVILNEELSSHMKVDRKILLEKFIEALENTHFQSHIS